MDTQDVIFQNLFNDNEYTRAVLPYLKPEYFTDNIYKTIFSQYNKFFEKYNVAPTIESFIIDLEHIGNISQDDYTAIVTRVSSYKEPDISDRSWLLDSTEEFCSERAIFNAIQASIKIISGEDEESSKGAIPELLQDALGVSFDNSVGHEYLDSAGERYDYLHKKENRIPFGIKFMDKITGGGLPDKTLSVFMAHSGGGKSAFLINYAANALLQGKNVLYITLELAEERVAERIDANLIGMDLSDIKNLEREKYVQLVESVKEKTAGKLIIKEYPTSSAHVGHFRHLARELKQKKNFIPDIIFIDYINICASNRAPANANSYTLVKTIAEELRAFSFENNCPIVSATQVARSGVNASDMEMSDVSESIGLVSTVDVFIGLISTEEMRQQGKVMVKQLKNRFNDISQDTKGMIGVDFAQMRFFDIEDSLPGMTPTESKDITQKPTFGTDLSTSDMFNKPDAGTFADFKI